MAIFVLVALVIFIGSCLQRISGMGVGLIAGPVLSVAIGPVEGIMVVNALALINSVLTTMSVRRDIDWRKYAMIASVLAFGAVPGALLVQAASAATLQILVGGLLLVALAVTTFGISRIPVTTGKAPALVAGVAGGFMNTVAGLAGPALTVYAQASRWEQAAYRATLQPIFATAAILSIGTKLTLGAGTLSDTDPGIWVGGLIGMVIGLSSGIYLAGKISKTMARKLALLLAAAGGVMVLLRGLAELV